MYYLIKIIIFIQILHLTHSAVIQQDILLQGKLQIARKNSFLLARKFSLSLIVLNFYFKDCLKQYSTIDEDLIDCIAYKLLLQNVQRLELNEDSECYYFEIEFYSYYNLEFI